MKIRSAEFLNFRNIGHFSFDFDDEMNIVFGKNAQGKTNVIEGIYLFAGGKSFRHAKDADMRKFGSDRTSVSVKFSSSDRDYAMSIALFGDKRKEMTKNGVKIGKISEFVGTFRSVLFCPSHLLVVQADPSLRRNFIDGAISQFKPKYLGALIEYGKILEQKNALLRSFEDHPDDFDTIYDIMTEKLAGLGGYITSVRAVYLEKLFGYVGDLLSDMSGEKAGYRYVSSVGEDVFDEAETEKKYRLAIEAHKEKEKIVGTSLVGPHRDDFEIYLGDRPAKTFASQGQQRSIALALKLAEGDISKNECGEYPVFLLDDVLSELDRDRKKYVLSRLSGRQVIITSCDENDFSGVTAGKKIFVENGNYSYTD